MNDAMVNEDAVDEASPNEAGPLLLGFDFGTSWTAVMSNRGHREVIRITDY